MLVNFDLRPISTKDGRTAVTNSRWLCRGSSKLVVRQDPEGFG